MFPKSTVEGRSQWNNSSVCKIVFISIYFSNGLMLHTVSVFLSENILSCPYSGKIFSLGIELYVDSDLFSWHTDISIHTHTPLHVFSFTRGNITSDRKCEMKTNEKFQNGSYVGKSKQ